MLATGHPFLLSSFDLDITSFSSFFVALSYPILFCSLHFPSFSLLTFLSSLFFLFPSTSSFSLSSDVQVCHQRHSSASDLLLIFLCSLIQALTLTPPPNNALLGNMDIRVTLRLFHFFLPSLSSFLPSTFFL